MTGVVSRPHSIDELLWHMTSVSRDTRATPWERGFAGDMAKRGFWRNWRPTSKQVATMRRIVSERMDPVDLIDG